MKIFRFSIQNETKEYSSGNKTFLHKKNVPCIQQAKSILACSQWVSKTRRVIHLVHLHFSFVFVYIYDQATLVLNCTHCEVVYNFLKLLQKSTKATCSNSSKIFRKVICLGTWQVHFFFSFFFWLHLKVQFLRSKYPSSDWIEENRTYMKWRWGKWVKTVKMLLTCKSLDLNQLLNV